MRKTNIRKVTSLEINGRLYGTPEKAAAALAFLVGSRICYSLHPPPRHTDSEKVWWEYGAKAGEVKATLARLEKKAKRRLLPVVRRIMGV